ncbi:hypothetical protein ACJJTC_014106 [Scirpophaga incertulas]
MYRYAFLLFIVVVSALPNPELNNNVEQTVESAARAMGKDCTGGIFSPTCIKIEAISMLEKLSAKKELRLLPGVTLVKEPEFENASKAEEFAAELARSLPSKPDERLDKYLLYKLGNYLDTHTIKLRLLDESTSEEARALVGDARAKGGFGGGGKKGGMGGMMAMGLLFKGTLHVNWSRGARVVGGKALMTAMMSLLLHSHSHSTAHEDVGGYGHSGYGRNLNVRRR